MRESKTVCIAAGLVSLGAWATLWIIARGGFGPSFDPRPHEATGWVMARQTLSLLKPGGQVIVISRDTTAFRNPASDIQLESFRKTLRGGGVNISKVQALQIDPLRPIEVPGGDFFELIRTTPKGGVIVSFMGPPLLSEIQRKQIGEVQPSIVAFCPGSLSENVDLRALFDQGLVHAAVVSRGRGPKPPSPSKDMQGSFDEFFLAVTSANAASLSSKRAGPGDLN
jgi:hypothetical protein